MDRTLVRDLLQSRALLFGEWTSETHRTLDAMNVAVLVLHTLLAILRIDPVLSQTHGHAFERPLLSTRIECHRHRNATAERREQQRVRIRTSIFTTGGDWFVSNE